MRKKKMAYGKWVLLSLLVGVLGLGYWLSLERAAPQMAASATVELKLQPLQ